MELHHDVYRLGYGSIYTHPTSETSEWTYAAGGPPFLVPRWPPESANRPTFCCYSWRYVYMPPLNLTKETLEAYV